MSPRDGEVDSSDGEMSAPEDCPTAGVERSMLSMWPGVRQCSLCSWMSLVQFIFVNR